MASQELIKLITQQVMLVACRFDIAMIERGAVCSYEQYVYIQRYQGDRKYVQAVVHALCCDEDVFMV